jgi:hypothetical protein
MDQLLVSVHHNTLVTNVNFTSIEITFLFHLNLSQSIYAESNNLKTVLKFLIIFLNEDQSLMIELFQIQVSNETNSSSEKTFLLILLSV